MQQLTSGHRNGKKEGKKRRAQRRRKHLKAQTSVATKAIPVVLRIKSQNHYFM